MARKQNRRARRSQQAQQQQGTAKRVRKQFLNTPSLIFIGLIVLMAALVAAATMLRGDDVPECPPGQVWSEAHGHCH